MTIALGEPTRIPESGALTHPRDSDFMLESACTVDPQLDVVIPAYWSAEATTVGFDTPIGMRALFAGGGAATPNGNYTGRGVAPFDGDGRILVAQSFSGGPSCKAFSSENDWGYGGSGGFGVQWDNPVPGGSVRTDEFFIVVKNYFSPAVPDGDRALLDWIVLRPFLGGDLNDAAMVYKDVDGWNVTTGSLKGITLNGQIVDSSIPTPTPSPTPEPSPTPTPRPFLNGPSRGDSVVTFTEARLLSEAGYWSGIETLAVLRPGTVLTIIGEPKRNEAGTYWHVRVDATGKTGWVHEDYIEPNPDAKPTPTPRPTPRPTAAATEVPAFAVGDSVATISTMHLRESATTSSNIVDTIGAGTVLTVTGGPYRDDATGWVFWQVTVDETGEVGYVREEFIELVPGGG